MSVSLRPMAWLALAAASAILGGCGNPAVDERVEDLGDELPGVEPSALHRPGQPCLLCHSKYGGAEPEMSIAGTIYATRDPVPDPNDPTKTIPSPPVGGAAVVLYDADNTTPKKRVLTNCAGNFFVTTEEYSADPSIATWNPAFPVYAEVQFTLKHSSGNAAEDQLKRSAMGTWIQRDGSCSTCHNGSPNQGSAGRIFCLEKPPAEPFLPFDVPTALTCPGGVPQ